MASRKVAKARKAPRPRKAPKARSTIQVVASGDAEPSAGALRRKQAAILKKLQSVTPDQLEAFTARSLDADLGETVLGHWQKTIWRK